MFSLASDAQASSGAVMPSAVSKRICWSGPADIGRYIVAVADLLGGDYATAMSYAQTVIEDDPAYTAEVALPEVIQAAVRAGDYEAAATAHKTLSERALAAGHAVGARPAGSLRGAAD